MITNKRFLFITVVLLAAYVLSACGGGAPVASPAEQASVKVDASLVAYTGTIEGMNGNQWIINGQTLTVDPAVVRDGPFQVGDVVKIEGNVNPDGSLTVSRIEAPSAADLTELPRLGDDNANSNDDNSNDANANSNDGNGNDDNANNANSNSNDDDSNDDNANLNSNDDDSNDDNANANSNDDNTNDDGNSNGNSNDDDSGSGGGGNGNDDNGGNSGDDGGSGSDDDGDNSNDD